jgi:hypothetical protein
VQRNTIKKVGWGVGGGIVQLMLEETTYAGSNIKFDSSLNVDLLNINWFASIL